MSKVQRLEQVQPEKVTFDTAALSADLEKALGFSAADHGKQLYFHGLSAGGTVTLDKGMLFQVAENLTTNALRFAKENVSVELSIEGENLKLEIADDGDGFPAELLKTASSRSAKVRKKRSIWAWDFISAIFFAANTAVR